VVGDKGGEDVDIYVEAIHKLKSRRSVGEGKMRLRLGHPFRFVVLARADLNVTMTTSDSDDPRYGLGITSSPSTYVLKGWTRMLGTTLTKAPLNLFRRDHNKLIDHPHKSNLKST
jgi:hypothetical protein